MKIVNCKLKIALVISLFAFPLSASAAVITWDGSGGDNSWENDSNWVGNVEPGSADIATFDTTSVANVTIDKNINVAGIDINTGYTGIITQSSTFTVTVGSSNYDQADGTFTGGSGTITINGTFTLSGGVFTSTSGTLTVTGNWTHTAGGTFTHNSGTVNFATAGDRTLDVTTSETFNNFTLGGNNTLTIASGDTAIVLGTFTQNSYFNSGIIEARSDVVIEANAWGGSGTLSFLVTGDQTITGNGGITANININKPSGTVSVTGDLNILSLTLASSGAGAFTAPTGTLTVRNDWTHTGGGTFNHNSGTVNFATAVDRTLDVTTSETFNNFTLGGNNSLTIASGDTAIVLGTFTQNSYFNSGIIEARSDVVIGAGAFGGFGTLSFLVAGDQTITTSGGSTGSLNINKASGTVSFSGTDISINAFTLASSGTGAFTAPTGTLTVRNDWTHTGGGTFNHNSGTVNFATGADRTLDVTTSETFNNFTVNVPDTVVISSGDILIVTNTFTHTDSWINTGTIEAQGAVTIGSGADGGSALLKFTGSAAQTYTDNGGNEMNGDITINKTGASDTVTLASNADWNATNQDLTITRGTLSQGASYNLLTGIITVATNGTWTNTGTGDVTLGGNVTNSGRITFNGGGSGCGTDSIAIASSNAANNRTWTTNTGAQTTLIDIAASDQAGTLTVYSSTNTSDNSWTFSDVCIEISGEQARKIRLTSVRLRNVRLR